ncbi:MAG: hypothetical protein QE274_03510 [Verrucomicrobiaceae bacterium]|nr:hypothetical protein [Verrucomicrobiaceae bacterium]
MFEDLVEEVHGAPLDVDDPPAVQEVDDQGDQEGGSAGQEDGGEEGQLELRNADLGLRNLGDLAHAEG